MRWGLLYLCTFLAFAQTANRQTISLEEYSPKSSLVVPENPRPRAKYPFIDVHSHHRFPMTPEAAQKVLAAMDAMNLRILVNLSGRFGGSLKQGAEWAKSTNGRMAVFANLDFSNIDDPGYGARAAAQLEQDVSNGARGLKFFKQFGMDLKDTKGERIHVDDPRFDPVFETCARLKIPVLIHTADPKQFWEPVDKFNERWIELNEIPGRRRDPSKNASWETLIAEQHNLFRRHKKTIFINAHLGWLGGDLARLGRLLDECPNVYTEIGAVLAELGRQPRNARAWFIRYQDRVLFGKDSWRPEEYPCYFRVLETADEYFDYYRKRHAFWKMYGLELPDEVLKKLYYTNALRIIPGLDASGFPQ
jgi:predicted TIM-barrel fold metal-dependent hydrolase